MDPCAGYTEELSSKQLATIDGARTYGTQPVANAVIAPKKEQEEHQNQVGNNHDQTRKS